MGVFYTQEFNRVSEIFRGRKNRERKKEENDAGDEAILPEQEEKTVK